MTYHYRPDLFDMRCMDQLFGIPVPEAARSAAVLPVLKEKITGPGLVTSPIDDRHAFRKDDLKTVQAWLAEPGQTLALIGGSQSGKTSWVQQLASRLNRPVRHIHCRNGSDINGLYQAINAEPGVTGEFLLLDDSDQLGKGAYWMLKDLADHLNNPYNKRSIVMTCRDAQINLPDSVYLGIRFGKLDADLIGTAAPGATRGAVEMICDLHALADATNGCLVTLARRLVLFGNTAEAQLAAIAEGRLLAMTCGFRTGDNA